MVSSGTVFVMSNEMRHVPAMNGYDKFNVLPVGASGSRQYMYAPSIGVGTPSSNIGKNVMTSKSWT